MNDSNIDIRFTKLALELGAKGIGLVSPNPLVGCVIAASNGEIVGEGTYRFDDLIHAEAIALEQASERAKGATAYVSLEPHSHHGKTPPCTEALINAGIKRVVCPIEDPNPLVSGRGFEALRNASLEVVTGILAEEAEKLNEKFICWHKKKRPFVHLKMAMSLDGRISLGKSVSTTLSGDAALKRVHELRHEYDAILVGGNTASTDNPSLTDRSDLPRRRQLARVILDNSLKTPLDSSLVKTAKNVPTIIFTSIRDSETADALRRNNVEIVETEGGGRDLNAVLSELKDRDIQSVLVEGGSAIAGSFIDAKLVDKVTFLMSPIIVGGSDAPVAVSGNGIANLADAFRLDDITVTRLGTDIEITGYPKQ